MRDSTRFEIELTAIGVPGTAENADLVGDVLAADHRLVDGMPARNPASGDLDVSAEVVAEDVRAAHALLVRLLGDAVVEARGARAWRRVEAPGEGGVDRLNRAPADRATCGR